MGKTFPEIYVHATFVLGTQIMWLKKHIGSKKTLWPRKMLVKKNILGPNINFGLEKIFLQKKFWSENSFNFTPTYQISDPTRSRTIRKFLRGGGC